MSPHTSKQSSQKHKSSVSVELLRLLFFHIFTRHQSLNADHSILLFIYVINVDNFALHHMITYLSHDDFCFSDTSGPQIVNNVDNGCVNKQKTDDLSLINKTTLQQLLFIGFSAAQNKRNTLFFNITHHAVCKPKTKTKENTVCSDQ